MTRHHQPPSANPVLVSTRDVPARPVLISVLVAGLCAALTALTALTGGAGAGAVGSSAAGRPHHVVAAGTADSFDATDIPAATPDGPPWG